MYFPRLRKLSSLAGRVVSGQRLVLRDREPEPRDRSGRFFEIRSWSAAVTVATSATGASAMAVRGQTCLRVSKMPLGRYPFGPGRALFIEHGANREPTQEPRAVDTRGLPLDRADAARGSLGHKVTEQIRLSGRGRRPRRSASSGERLRSPTDHGSSCAMARLAASVRRWLDGSVPRLFFMAQGLR